MIIKGKYMKKEMSFKSILAGGLLLWKQFFVVLVCAFLLSYSYFVVKPLITQTGGSDAKELQIIQDNVNYYKDYNSNAKIMKLTPGLVYTTYLTYYLNHQDNTDAQLGASVVAILDRQLHSSVFDKKCDELLNENKSAHFSDLISVENSGNTITIGIIHSKEDSLSELERIIDSEVSQVLESNKSIIGFINVEKIGVFESKLKDPSIIQTIQNSNLKNLNEYQSKLNTLTDSENRKIQFNIGFKRIFICFCIALVCSIGFIILKLILSNRIRSIFDVCDQIESNPLYIIEQVKVSGIEKKIYGRDERFVNSDVQQSVLVRELQTDGITNIKILDMSNNSLDVDDIWNKESNNDVNNEIIDYSPEKINMISEKDSVIVVVKKLKTEKTELINAINNLQRIGANVVGTIFVI